MKRFPKIEHPFRKTIIFLALMGFCFSSSLVCAVLCLCLASVSFLTIILQTTHNLMKKKQNPLSPVPLSVSLSQQSAAPALLFANELEKKAVREQIKNFMQQVGQISNFGNGQLPAPPDDSRMAGLQKSGLSL